MRFARPELLALVPVLWVALGYALFRARRRQRTLLSQFAGARNAGWAGSGFSVQRRFWDTALLFATVTGLLLTLSRPLYFKADERSEVQGAPYLIALDASRSMLATDVLPSRYAAATNALDHFLSEAQSDRIGLITFSGIGYLNAPLTSETAALRTILSYINPHALVDPGSSIASALDRAARFFTSNALPQRTLVLITDGEDLDGQSVAKARRLYRDQNVVVHTIGVGTTTGASIPAFRDLASTNAGSRTIVTKLDENNLRRIANAGGGRYFPLGPNGRGLARLRAEVLRPLAEKEARADTRNYEEGFWVPLGLAAMAILARLWVGANRHRVRRPLPAILEGAT